MTGMTLARAWPDLLTTKEAQLLSDRFGPPVPFMPRQQILCSGKVADGLLYLSDGFVGRYRCNRL